MPASAGDVWVVDDDGPANFTDLPAAVASAHDGDTLVLRPGRYGAVTFTGKGLSIVGAGSGSTFIERREGEGPFLAVSGLAADQRLVLSGFSGIGRGTSLELGRIGGLLIVTDLVVDGRDGATGPRLDQCARAYLARIAVVPPIRAMANRASVGAGIALSSGSYSLTQVVAVGGNGASATSPGGRAQRGGAGLNAQHCDVELALCDFVGGRGGEALWNELAPFCPEAAYAGSGGAGVTIMGRSQLRAAGDGAQRFVGGDGGHATRNPFEECWSFAGSGANGLQVALDAGSVMTRPSLVQCVGGEAGAGTASRAGRDASAIEATPPLAESGRRWPTLALESAATVGGLVRLRVFGTPGEHVRLFVGIAPAPIRLKHTEGFRFHLATGQALDGNEVGVIGSDGQLLIERPLPEASDLVGQVVALQAIITTRDDRRDSRVSNVDLLVVGDGKSPARRVGRE